MRVMVIGAGIVGLTTAWQLQQSGHAVTLVDAQPQPGNGTSQANGAQLSYRFVAPLADPAIFGQLVKWLGRSDAPLQYRPSCSWSQWRWLSGFLKNCNRATARESTRNLLALGVYSQQLMHAFIAQHAIPFEYSQTGKLQLYESTESFQRAQAQVGYQASLGITQSVLDVDACIALEPAISHLAPQLVGGIYTATEEAGDCYQLCLGLYDLLQRDPHFISHLGCTAQQLVVRNGRIEGVTTDQGDLSAEGYVIANGTGAPTLLANVGIHTDIYPLRGYSLTYQLSPGAMAPQLSLSDIKNKVVYARLGDRLRVAGMMDIGHFDEADQQRRSDTLVRQSQAMFPVLRDLPPPSRWTGLRPARPSSQPLISGTRFSNLWLNVGQGALGFTLAMGSARLLADQINRCPSAIDPSAFALT